MAFDLPISLTPLVVAMLTAGVAFAQSGIPRPEHPEPQAVRQHWLNLNGTWEFAETDDVSDESFLARERFPESIVVPFCRESKLSGLGRTGFVKCVWYRRHIEVPESWAGQRVLLHIGACDWQTTVWIDEHKLGTHTGGNVPITFELTRLLRPEGNALTIRAFDDTRSGLQQLGKQSDREDSYGIFYTRTTGIWQTVWLEAVGPTYIANFAIVPDPDAGRVVFSSDLNGCTEALDLRVEVFADGEKVGDETRPASPRDTLSIVKLARKRLWSVADPFLYTATLSLLRGDEVVDRVNTYFGLRKIEIQGRQFVINGEPVFQRLVLDQGFYPDGIWTAPTDADLRRDIELSKAAGFNGARLHQKVFEPRFHYWADRLGYLTWGEGPSFGPNYADPRVNLPIVHEWTQIVRRDRNHPSIIGWCPFNETRPEAGPLQNAIYELVRALDPTRPLIDSSGYYKSHPNPDVDCRHDYTQDGDALAARWAQIDSPWRFPEQYGIRSIDRPFFLSEFGGIGWVPEGQEGWGYGNNPQTLEEFYDRYDALMRALQDNRFMFAFGYTQLTDVEQERNGIYYYDRSPKFDMERIRAITARPAAYEQNPPSAPVTRDVRWLTLLAAAVDLRGPTVWRYALDSPQPGWQSPGFDDSNWRTGAAGFGNKGGWEERINTPWTTPDIWLRRTFDYDGAPFDAAFLMLHYDNATAVYLNGSELLSLERWNDAYAPFDVSAAIRPLLKKGRNLLAIHTHQDTGGQFIDLALLLARQ
ncbi:MAG: sugar-binding domain-containing protein [Phycisphaerae bacterium]